MIILLVTALHATETLKTFHLERVVSTAGKTRDRDVERGVQCAEDAEDITQRDRRRWRHGRESGRRGAKQAFKKRYMEAMR
jgi:hypothetical protein